MKGHWSSDWPTAGGPLLGPELLQCWAVTANTFWPATANHLRSAIWECACSAVGNLITTDLLPVGSQPALSMGGWPDPVSHVAALQGVRRGGRHR